MGLCDGARHMGRRTVEQYVIWSQLCNARAALAQVEKENAELLARLRARDERGRFF